VNNNTVAAGLLLQPAHALPETSAYGSGI